MKRVARPVFFVILALILAMTVASVVGVAIWNGDIEKTYLRGTEHLRWGLELQQGAEAVYSSADGYTPSEGEMAAAKSILEMRLASQSITDYEVRTDSGANQITVRFPWQAREIESSPEKVAQELGETARFTFREGAEYDQTTGLPTGVTAETILLQGEDVAHAEVLIANRRAGSATGQPVVSVQLSPEGTAKFAQASERLAGSGSISMWVDGTMVAAPQVDQPILDGRVVIPGNFTARQAKTLADRINAGALPFALEHQGTNRIAPALGVGTKAALLVAAGVAFVLACVFLLVRYRVPGVVASIVLLGQAAVMIASASGFFGGMPGTVLTLPGVAGIILSMILCVDAGIISGERIKEEMRNGKTIDGAIGAGYVRAFPSILDSNVAVAILSLILLGAFAPLDSLLGKVFSKMFFFVGPAASGTIFSFGYMLLLGTIFNLIFSRYISRWLLKSLSKYRPMRKAWLYGGLREGEEDKAVQQRTVPPKNVKRSLTVSAGLVAVLVIVTAIIQPQRTLPSLAQSMVTLALALVLVVLYLAGRFRRMDGLSVGVLSVAALLHDGVVVLGVFALCGIPLGGSFVAAILTTLAFSLGDTVVLFDRIRENRKLHGKKMPVEQVVGLSINQSLTRSVSTVAVAIGAMAVVSITALFFGVTAVLAFSLPVMVGLVSSVYSSVCIAGPLWTKWQQSKLAKKAR